MTFVPYLADAYGRKLVFCISVAVQSAMLLAMMLSDNLYELYVWEFLMGCTFVGRVIIGLSYLVEYQPIRYQEDIVFLFLFIFNML